MNLTSILPQILKWKAQGKTIVFTNGVFDILHVGHVRYLTEAAKLGDKLIVAVNSDLSVKRLEKGDDRPIHPEAARWEVIKALKPVADAFVFNEDTPLEVIKAIQPDVLVKGGDYDPQESNPKGKKYIVGSDLVKAAGGKVATIDLVKGFSSTAAIKGMKK